MIPKEISEEPAQQELEIPLKIKECVDRLIAEQGLTSCQEKFNKGEESEWERTGLIAYRQERVYCSKELKKVTEST